MKKGDKGKLLLSRVRPYATLPHERGEVTVLTVIDPHGTLPADLQQAMGPALADLYRLSFTSPFARDDMTLEHALKIALGPAIDFVQLIFLNESLAGAGPVKVLRPGAGRRVYYRNASALHPELRGRGLYAGLITAPLAADFPLGPFDFMACMTQNVRVWQAWRKYLPEELWPRPEGAPSREARAFAEFYSAEVLRPIPEWGKGDLDLVRLVQRRRWPESLYDSLPRSRNAEVNTWWFGEDGLAMGEGDMAYLFVNLDTGLSPAGRFGGGGAVRIRMGVGPSFLLRIAPLFLFSLLSRRTLCYHFFVAKRNEKDIGGGNN